MKQKYNQNYQCIQHKTNIKRQQRLFKQIYIQYISQINDLQCFFTLINQIKDILYKYMELWFNNIIFNRTLIMETVFKFTTQQFQINNYMPKLDQIVQEKVLTFKTLTVINLEQVSKFVMNNLKGYQCMPQDQKARLYSMTNSVLIPALQSEWSFGLCQEDKIIGAYLQIDVLDYLKISKLVGRQAISQIFNVGQFQQYFNKLMPNIARGDYIITIFNMVNSNSINQINRKQLNLINQGFYLIKLGGWKNILFTTDNPIPFLKISSEVVMQSHQHVSYPKKYLMKMKMSQFNPIVSPFKKIYAKL